MDEIKLILPQIKAPTGEAFEITPTDTPGVFKTYSGSDLNFGYGNTTYIAYVYSNDGRSMFYSDSRTNFTSPFPNPVNTRCTSVPKRITLPTTANTSLVFRV